MKTLENIILVIAAIFVARVLVTVIGLLFSITLILVDLPFNQADLRAQYEIIIMYFLLVSVFLIVASVNLYRKVTKRNSISILAFLTIVSFALYLAHLVFFLISKTDQYFLAEFAQSFVWVPILASIVAFTSLRLKVRSGVLSH